MIANAQIETYPIIFCNDGFCELTGFSRAEVMQKSCLCEFLHCSSTGTYSVLQIKEALQGTEEKQVEIMYSRKDGKSLLLLCFYHLIYLINRMLSLVVYKGSSYEGREHILVINLQKIYYFYDQGYVHFFCFDGLILSSSLAKGDNPLCFSIILYE